MTALADAVALAEEERAALSGEVRDRAAPPTVAEAPRAPLTLPPTPLIGREHELAEVEGCCAAMAAADSSRTA